MEITSPLHFLLAAVDLCPENHISLLTNMAGVDRILSHSVCLFFSENELDLE